MTTATTTAAPAPVRILGREPAAWIGLVEAALILLASFGLGWEEHTQALLAVVTAAFGVYTAWAIKDTLLGVITGLVKSLLVLAAVYGLDLTGEQTGAIIATATILISFWERTQTSPEHFPADPSPEQVVASPYPPPAPDPGESDQEVNWNRSG